MSGSVGIQVGSRPLGGLGGGGGVHQLNNN